MTGAHRSCGEWLGLARSSGPGSCPTPSCYECGARPTRVKVRAATGGWRLHDLRRTVRTRMAGLRVPHAVAELVLGHGKRGLARVYDQHSYLPEMREALERWADELARIVGEPGANQRVRSGFVCSPPPK
jgi:integrase